MQYLESHFSFIYNAGLEFQYLSVLCTSMVLNDITVRSITRPKLTKLTQSQICKYASGCGMLVVRAQKGQK